MRDRVDERPAFLRDPSPAEVRYTVISVDDHVVEPRHTFEGRLPRRLQERAPKIVEIEWSIPSERPPRQAWVYEGRLFTQLGLNAVAGYDLEDYRKLGDEPTRFDEMRPGCYDVDARVHDMDLGGIWASLNFPSQIAGFCGAVFSRSDDPELGQAVVRAWNDWLYEEWWSPHPDRIIPLGITWLADPEAGADEIRRNAERGFVAVSLPELPHRLGFPSLHSGYWDPILAACVDTDTVVCSHVGSSGPSDHAADAPGREMRTTLFPALSLLGTIDWLWSQATVRFPQLRVVMAEGGIGWVPMLIDRLRYIADHSGAGGAAWTGVASPAEVLEENFYFCTLDDPSTIVCRDTIGVDHIMVEVDYPHSDSTWPTTQDLLHRRFGDLPMDEVRKMTHENAARLFRHPLPPTVLP